MLRALLPLLATLAACTPADPPLLIDEGRTPAATAEETTVAEGDPAAESGHATGD